MRGPTNIRLGLGVALALASIIAAPTTGAAAATAASANRPWKIQKSPNSTLPGGALDSVACSSADACTAVGTHLSVSGLTATLAERWNGTSWKTQLMPNLPDVTAANFPQLLSVSCPSARFCSAVGGTGPGSSAVTRAASEVWNGGSWKLRPVPLPAGSTQAGLSQVSCVSPTFCEAVGSRFRGSVPVTLAEVWRGSRWRVQRSPSPFLQMADTFSGVSCASAVLCEAVGSNVITGAVFAERWNGTSWRLQSLPVPLGPDAVISCASATFCEAIGLGAARWDGISWRAQAVPRPAGASFIDLTGVSCVSKKFCDAVGMSSNGVAAVAWRGTSWRSQPIPSSIEASQSSRLTGVWCTAADRCEGAGRAPISATTRPAPLVARWNGHSWLRQQAPAPTEAVDNSLTAVSCVGKGFCAAVGSRPDISANEIALAEIRNGNSWTLSRTPNPTRVDGGVRQTFDAVSCVSAKFCIAVGESSASPGRGQTPGAGAEIWNGTSWRMLSIPGNYPLSSVSCVSARFCVAVGGVAEVDQWNGHSWSARPSVAGFVLSSVSCVSAHYCDAVGSEASGDDAETWNGTAWRPQQTPPPPQGDSFIILNAVSCVTRNYCVIVGNTSTNLATGVATTVVELWQGSSWAVLHMPANPQATGSYLNGVSCSSTTSCTAVGLYTFGTPPIPGATLPARTLAEAWNGSAWTLRTTPNQSPTADVLSGVSCRLGQACTAVGSGADLGGFETTLVEFGN